MNLLKALLVIVGAFIVAAIFVGGCIYSGYNRAVTRDETVNSHWAEIENQMQRRFDLIDNLVETVKGYAAHEQDVFLGVAEARKAYFQAKESDSAAQMARANDAFSSVLSRLLVLRETYPELKANESFLKLQDQLEGTENRLAVARKRYNDAVRELNTFRRRALGRFYASLADVEPREYFEIEEAARTAPKVRFSSPPEPERSPATAPVGT